MKLAKEIAETLYKLMTPEPTSADSSIGRIPRMAVHAGSMEAVIAAKLEPVREALKSLEHFVCTDDQALSYLRPIIAMLSEED